jgi:hypothetical protein
LIRRPALLMTVSVHHAKLPLGMIWLPIATPLVWLLMGFCALVVLIVPQRRLHQHGLDDVSVPFTTISYFILKSAFVMLCSGSYTFVNIQVESEEEKIGICVRFY